MTEYTPEQIEEAKKWFSSFMGIVSLFKGTVEQRGSLSAYAVVKEKIANGF